MRDEVLKGQFYVIIIAKGDWALERPEGKICTVLGVSELWLGESTEGHFCAILEDKGGWFICTLRGYMRKGENLED